MGKGEGEASSSRVVESADTDSECQDEGEGEGGSSGVPRLNTDTDSDGEGEDEGEGDGEGPIQQLMMACPLPETDDGFPKGATEFDGLPSHHSRFRPQYEGLELANYRPGHPPRQE